MPSECIALREMLFPFSALIVILAELLLPLVMMTYRLWKLRVMLRNASVFLALLGTIRGLRLSVIRLLSSLLVPVVLWVVSASA